LKDVNVVFVIKLQFWCEKIEYFRDKNSPQGANKKLAIVMTTSSNNIDDTKISLALIPTLEGSYINWTTLLFVVVVVKLNFCCSEKKKTSPNFD